jgi:hypothetical protein
MSPLYPLASDASDAMSDEPEKRSRTWIGWIGALLALSAAASLGGFLIYCAYDAGKDIPIFDLPYRSIDVEDVGTFNGAALVGSLFGAGMLLITVGVLALIRE